MAGRAALEAVPLHCSLEALADSGAGYVDLLAGGKVMGAELEPKGQKRVGGDGELVGDSLADAELGWDPLPGLGAGCP